jgi:hypothetical protein
MNRPNRTRTLFVPFAASRKLPALVAVVALGVVTSLRAEPPTAPQDAPGAQSEQMQAVKQLYGEYMELRQRLAMIQQKAVQANPELQKQGQDLQALMMSKMSSSTGVNAKDEMAAINEIEKKLRNKDTPDSERQKLLPEYQKRVEAFRDAQMQVMKDPEVQKAQTALMEATTAAMKQQDPQTEELMAQVKQKQEQLQKLTESTGRAK